MNEHFDAQAETWDEDPDKVRRSREVAALIASVVELEAGTHLLEYGAGTGLVTQSLAEHVERATLADSSAGMRRVLERKITQGLLPPGSTVWDLDLARDAAPKEQFDLVISSLVLHHIPELAPVLNGFRRLVTPHGVLCIIDLDVEDGTFHEHVHDFHGHDGFDRKDLADRLTEAGFDDVSFHDAGRVRKEDRDFGLFLAVARPRPSS